MITYILDLDEFYQLVQLWRYGSSGMNEQDVDGWVVLGLAAISDRELDNNVASILHEAEHAAEVDAELQAEAEIDDTDAEIGMCSNCANRLGCPPSHKPEHDGKGRIYCEGFKDKPEADEVSP